MHAYSPAAFCPFRRIYAPGSLESLGLSTGGCASSRRSASKGTNRSRRHFTTEDPGKHTYFRIVCPLCPSRVCTAVAPRCLAGDTPRFPQRRRRPSGGLAKLAVHYAGTRWRINLPGTLAGVSVTKYLAALHSSPRYRLGRQGLMPFFVELEVKYK